MGKDLYLQIFEEVESIKVSVGGWASPPCIVDIWVSLGGGRAALGFGAVL